MNNMELICSKHEYSRPGRCFPSWCYVTKHKYPFYFRKASSLSILFISPPLWFTFRKLATYFLTQKRTVTGLQNCNYLEIYRNQGQLHAIYNNETGWNASESQIFPPNPRCFQKLAKIIFWLSFFLFVFLMILINFYIHKRNVIKKYN